MSRFDLYRGHGITRCVCHKHEEEPVVRKGLSYSPADMAKLTDRGMPVNGLNTQQVFFDGEVNPSWFIGAERERFVDVAELWEKDQILKDKARKARSMSKKS